MRIKIKDVGDEFVLTLGSGKIKTDRKGLKGLLRFIVLTYQTGWIEGSDAKRVLKKQGIAPRWLKHAAR